VLDAGRLPDLQAFTEDGTPISLRELASEGYLVLKSGCLTCPKFHASSREFEAAAVDYEPMGVTFYYFYKSLRHPELGGYVEAQNLEERLLHIKEARTNLGTRVPWIADSMDDSLRVGLRSGANSVYLVSPEGEIVYAAGEYDAEAFRDALTKAVGEPKERTSVQDLNLPRLERNRQINETTDIRVERPVGMTILEIQPVSPEDTYYVKLRAEADRELLRSGGGKLFIGFYPDPIHGAKWNNLTSPMKYVLSAPDGSTVTPAEAVAHRGEGETDTEPRQFMIDVSDLEPGATMKLSLHYFGCTDDFCKPLTHEYLIRLAAEDRAASTFGFRGGERSGSRGRGDRQR
tara:strand:+ start:94000 stop:95037 length:1038 start_codon:yes stop_codon:yes gene_type:complete